MSFRDFFEIMLLCVIFGGILFATYFVTKKMALINKKMQFNKNMQIIEVLQLSQGQYLYIIKIGEEYHLIGGAKDNISYCTVLDKNILNLEPHEATPFHEYLNSFVKGKQVKDNEK